MSSYARHGSEHETDAAGNYHADQSEAELTRNSRYAFCAQVYERKKRDEVCEEVSNEISV